MNQIVSKINGSREKVVFATPRQDIVENVKSKSIFLKPKCLASISLVILIIIGLACGLWLLLKKEEDMVPPEEPTTVTKESTIVTEVTSPTVPTEEGPEETTVTEEPTTLPTEEGPVSNPDDSTSSPTTTQTTSITTSPPQTTSEIGTNTTDDSTPTTTESTPEEPFELEIVKREAWVLQNLDIDGRYKHLPPIKQIILMITKADSCYDEVGQWVL